MLPIHHTFAPLADSHQIRLACSLVFQAWKWRNGTAVKELEEKLAQRWNGEAFAFGSGRECLLAILRSLHLQKDEEVIVQGYTCVVVPNAIIAAGMQPVYADIEEGTLNLDLEDVERHITPKTRAIICQHTFGIPAFTKRLRDICDRHSLILIEDCAHIMPDEKGPEEIGRYGDFLFFSFGRDKAISGVAGGAVICRQKDICSELGKLRDDAQALSLIHIKRYLLYPIIYGITRPLYGIGIGKIILGAAGKLRLLVPITTHREKKGSMDVALHHMPNACAILALDQLNHLQQINDHRRKLTKLYFDEFSKRGWPMLAGITPDLPLQKFPLFTQRAEAIRQKLKKQNIILYDGWTGCVICPESSDCEAVGYKDGDDPDAEMAGQQILSLPTHPTMTVEQARRLIDALDPYFLSPKS